MNVLLADDDAHVRSALRLLLEAEPDVAIVGESASTEGLFESARTSRPGVVVLDWDLPGLRASGVLERLRSLEPPPHILALSGRPEGRREAAMAGIPWFVCKGDAPETLLTTLRCLR